MLDTKALAIVVDCQFGWLVPLATSRGEDQEHSHQMHPRQRSSSCLSFHLFVHPKCSRINLGKPNFDPFLTHFRSQNGPCSRHFGTLRGPKRATTGSKQAKNTCPSTPRGPGSFLEKVVSPPPPLDPIDPFWRPLVWARACSVRKRSGPRYRCLGVRLGHFEGWKPQKVGGCGWTRCLRNRVVSHRAQDTAYFWFGAIGGQSAQILGLYGTFLGCFSNILWS